MPLQVAADFWSRDVGPNGDLPSVLRPSNMTTPVAGHNARTYAALAACTGVRIVLVRMQVAIIATEYLEGRYSSAHVQGRKLLGSSPRPVEWLMRTLAAPGLFLPRRVLRMERLTV